MTSIKLREMMIELKEGLKQIHLEQRKQSLNILSAGRFDQQETTKFHRDGAPDETLLMLGYEPSNVRSKLQVADYSKCAEDMGLTPKELLLKHNPMFGKGEELLKPYVIDLKTFHHQAYFILLLNNSSSTRGHHWQGLLHTATIINPSEEQKRVVNSMMIASASEGTPEPVSKEEQQVFINSDVVLRYGYDKPHLKK